METGGSLLQTVAEPVSYDRNDVIYPIAVNIDAQRKTVRWIAEKDRPYEPLPAGVGRYMLFGTCAFLQTDGAGWEYCGAYENRPGVCRDFEEAGPTCQILRLRQGVDTPSD